MRLFRRFARPGPGVAIAGAVVLGSVVLGCSPVLAASQAAVTWVSFGAEAVCCSVFPGAGYVAPRIERAFGGLDRVAQWHRRTAVAAVILMVVHPVLAGSPPVPNASVTGLRLLTSP